MVFEYLSVSKIATMLRCPRQFFYQFIEKIPYEPPRYMIDGRNIHTAMEHFFNYVNPQVILLNKSYEQFVDYFFRLTMGNLPRGFQLIPQYRTTLFNFAQIEARLLLQVKQSFKDTTKILSHWFPIARELNLKNLDLKLSGTVDRVDNLFGEYEGELAVIDYKTGSAPKPKKQRDGSLKREIPSDIRRQLGIYKMLLEAGPIMDENFDLNGREIKYMCAVYPATPAVIFEEIKSITLTYAKRARDKALRLANKGDTIADFPCKIGGQCFSRGKYRGCIFFQICHETWTEDMLLYAQKVTA